MASLDALRQYAVVKNPGRQISATVRLASTTSTITIFDAYPKARYHLLCLPRFPYQHTAKHLAESTDVGLNDFDSLSSLLKLPTAVARSVLSELQRAGDEAREMVEDEMLKTEGFVWDVYLGFHAAPSMRHLHLHVISSDLVSPYLKHKHHYNSFRPDSGFFIHLHEVITWLADDSSQAYLQTQLGTLTQRASILKQPLSCFKCLKTFSTMPSLKSHLEEEWRKQLDASRVKPS